MAPYRRLTRFSPRCASFPMLLHTVAALAAAGLLMTLLPLAPAWASPPAQGGDVITFGEPVTGYIGSGSDSEQIWRFDGQAGDLVIIDMRAANVDLLDTYLTLTDANGQVLDENDDGGDRLNSRIGPLTLPETAEYRIIASRYSGEGEYTLELQGLNAIPTLTLDKPVAGTINSETPTDYFVINANTPTDTLLRLIVNEDQPGGASLTVEVFGPQGLMASSSFLDNPVNSIEPLVLSPDTRYVVGVRAGESSGDYVLRLTRSNVTILEPGEATSGRVELDEYSDYHYFSSQAGREVRVTVTSDGELAPGVSVRTGDQNNELFYSGGIGAQTISVTVVTPQDGLYVVEIYDMMYESGGYTVLVEFVD